MLRRRASRFERSFLKTEQGVQIAAVVSHPRHVDAYVDKLMKSIAALHVRFDGRDLHWVDGPPPVATIPSTVKNAFQACGWAFRTLNQRSMYERAAALAVRDTMIVVATNHGLLDGGSTPSLCNMRPVRAPKFPLACDDLFSDELAKVTKAQVDSYMERASHFTTWPLSKTGTTDNIFCEYIWEKHPPERFQCYDKKRRQLRGLTEAQWAAMLLPTIAMTGRFDKLGIGTCYNVRPLTGRKDVDVGNIFAPVPVVCARANDPNMTVAELGIEMRKDFIEGGKRRDWLTGLKTCWAEYDPRKFTGLVPLLSSAGVLKLEDPVVDFWGQQAMKSQMVGTLLLISLSVVGPNGMEVYTRLQYPPTTVSKEDADLCLKMIMHVLLNIPPSTTLRDAVDELRKLRPKDKN